MATASPPKKSPRPIKKRTSFSLKEYQIVGKKKIDTGQQIIYDAKILGWQSKNSASVLGNLSRRDFGKALDQPYSYDQQAGERIAARYDGKNVNIDHIDPLTDRSATQVFGKIKGSYATKDGIYAKEIHYFENDPPGTNPMASKVEQDVERGLNVFTFSHVSVGKEAALREGRIMITDWEPQDVDLVSKGATNISLHESKKPTKIPEGKLYITETTTKTVETILQENEIPMDRMNPSHKTIEVVLQEDYDNLDELKKAILEMCNKDMEEETVETLKARLVEMLGAPVPPDEVSEEEEPSEAGDSTLGTEDSTPEEAPEGTEEPAEEPSEEVPQEENPEEVPTDELPPEEGEAPEEPPEEEEEEMADKKLAFENLKLKTQNLLLESNRWTSDEETNEVRIKAVIPFIQENKVKEARRLIESWESCNKKPDISNPPKDTSNSIVREKFNNFLKR